MFNGRSLLFVSLLLAFVTTAYSQGKVNLNSDLVWGRANYNRVTVNLGLPSANVLTRFALELPPGFEVVGEKTQGGDLYVANNTLYIVWVKPLRYTQLEISFFVRPPAGSRDNVLLEATLAYISEPGGRVVIRSVPHDITIRSGGGLTASQVEALREKSSIVETPPAIPSAQPPAAEKSTITTDEPVSKNRLQENLISDGRKEVVFTKVASAPSATEIGLNGWSIEPNGVDFATLPTSEVGEYWPFVSP